MRLNRRQGCVLALAFPIAILLLWAGPIQWWMRYQSWSHLSKDKLLESAKWYIANRAPGNNACIFAVECNGGRASLKLVKSIEEWDLEKSKRIAWDRKFKGVCQGQTANFALEVATDNLQSRKTFEGAGEPFGRSTTIVSSPAEPDSALLPLARARLNLV